ncbi:hypothetical protein GJ744_004815 [Endocarpon pusillum]|uniref:Heterokaryon incompatibility domain-containing protein n=1 Tax=Endocarpon pusillum TaxID=364733 RepID=A0A8H7ACU1_9EURO|nr:hypothetical protein GJ744_004815 [Endocarpon pusillum]
MVQRANSFHVLQHDLLKVDYRKGSVDVYCDFVRAIMQSTKTPQYITKVWGQSISTWAVDLMANTKTSFSASKVSPTPTLRFTVDGHLLRLHCVTFSEIIQFGEYLDDNFYTGRFEESALHPVLETPGPYPTGHNVVEVLWRTLICDHDLEQHPARDSLSLSFRSWLTLEAMRAVGTSLQAGGTRSQHLLSMPSFDLLAGQDPTSLVPTHAEIRQECDKAGLLEDHLEAEMYQCYPLTLAERAYSYMTVVQLRMNKSRLFRLASGHVGIGPKNIREGDVVCVVSDVTTPFVLRRIQHDQPNRCHLLGEAYVHGIMHGEAVDEMDIALTEYCIE